MNFFDSYNLKCQILHLLNQLDPSGLTSIDPHTTGATGATGSPGSLVTITIYS